MRVVGIDPGIARTGFGVVDWTSEGPIHVFNSLIETDAGMPQPARLKKLYTNLCTQLSRFKPEVVVMERLYFSKNVKTAIAVGQACGVILMSLAGRDIELIEQTPPAMKKALTSNGRASKQDVRKMVTALLDVSKAWEGKKVIDDEVDALALALTYRPAAKILYPESSAIQND